MHDPRDGTAEKRRIAPEETLTQLPEADIVLTDGSVIAGLENGGAGVVAWEGGEEVKRIRTRTEKYTSSFTAELHALGIHTSRP